MIARKIIVVPCIVNSWLYVSGDRKVFSADAQLDAKQQRLDPAHQEEEERRGAVEDPDALVVDRRDPAPEPGLLAVGRRVRLVLI